MMSEVKLLLQHAALKDKSTRLAKVASFLAVGQNPFTEVQQNSCTDFVCVSRCGSCCALEPLRYCARLHIYIYI